MESEDTPVQLQLCSPDRQTFATALGPPPPDDWITFAGGVFTFSIPDDKNVYLSSGGHSGFSKPPSTCPFPLAPLTDYIFAGDVEITGGEVRLWLIEYSDGQRLGHQVATLKTGPLRLRWRTGDHCDAWCLALRFAGRGSLRLDSLTLRTQELIRLSKDGDMTFDACVHTGPEGHFRRYSIFADPCGYRAYTEKHHHFYDQREPSYYARVAKSVEGAKSVLDIECGPGLLVQCLYDKGLHHLLGIARDQFYLEQCHRQHLPVLAHDLNQPFSFIASNSFDAIIIHHTLDYLAPIAMRICLREAARVLHGGGSLHIASRADGQASGDVTRTIALSVSTVETLLSEAGFTEIEVEPKGRNFLATARKSSHHVQWPAYLPRLASGHEVRPWTAPLPALAAADDAWDADGNRDFTLLTTPEKDEVRVAGKCVAFYTGYRTESGSLLRAICRAESDDGITWRRSPASPVLESGGPGEWDEGGTAAGSILKRADGPAPFVMYYSAKAADGQWPGIGLAFSDDSVHWVRQPEIILPLDAFEGLRHLALADVIRTAAGQWLMHCEAWQEGGDWAIVQARSSDGLYWTPTQRTPVLHPRDIPWGNCRAANPKCIEITAGHLLLGFNAADDLRAFHLGLAESADGRRWRLLDVNPVICPTGSVARLESFFFTRDAWRRGDGRTFFFQAPQLKEPGSEVVTAAADTQAAWPALDWQTTRRGLYRIREDRLIAAGGAVREEHALHREVSLDRETQCTVRLAPENTGEGGVALSLHDDDQRCDIELRADGSLLQDGSPLANAAAETPLAPSLCLRVLRPRSDSPELHLTLWHGDTIALQQHRPLGFVPHTLRAAVQVPPGQPDLVVDHVDLWQPAERLFEGCGDAHQYLGITRSDEPLLPDLSAAAVETKLRSHDIGRILAMSYGPGRMLDTFDEVCTLSRTAAARVYPLYRCPARPGTADTAVDFELHQMELLWQEGLLYGLKIHLGTDEPPPPAVLDWIERRQLLTLWHVTRAEQLSWIAEHVLDAYAFPVLLSHFAGYPLDRGRYATAIDMLSRHPQLYLVTSCVWFEAYLREAIERHPDRVLFGSDSPAINAAAARATIEQLDVPDAARALVLGENLRFLTERVQWHRWNALRTPESLMFPRLPANEEDLRRQGFKIVTPGDLPPAEPQSAKDFWGGRGKVSWYERQQPWRAMIANLVKELQAQSVLEFGCNVGQNLAAIHAAVPEARLVGIDINPQAVALGREKTGLDLRVGDESALDAFGDGEFDLVFTISVLDHVADVDAACRRLLRVVGRYLYLLEVHLPVEGKVIEHFDHHHGGVRPSTGASYSWHLEKHLRSCPRVWRLDCRPVYLHAASLGPYYWAHLAFLERGKQP